MAKIIAIKEQLNGCPDCGVEINEVHLEGCDVERCARCGRQRISCGCARYSDLRRRRRLPWTGTWPGVADCHRLGWFVKMGPGGWQRCGRRDPAAVEDLNRLYVEGRWNAERDEWEAAAKVHLKKGKEDT